MKEEIEKAVKAIQEGGTVVYPTDTIWGVGCDATNPEAVKKVNELKGRPENKSLIVLVSSDVMLERYVKQVPNIAWEIIDSTEDPITIVYDEGVGLAANVLGEDGSAAIRIAKDPFCKQLIEKLRKPIVSTSANLASEPPPQEFEDISQPVLDGADYVVHLNLPRDPERKPSAIIKLSVDGTVKVIRE